MQHEDDFEAFERERISQAEDYERRYGSEGRDQARKQSLLPLTKPVLGAIVLAAVAYAVWTFGSSRIPNRPPEIVPSQVWADPTLGAAIELLDRQVGSAGWAPSRADWHPQARLKAMPAFQLGIADVLSGFAAQRASLRADDLDEGLELAATLLLQADGEGATDRLSAASQALRRYDGLKARQVRVSRTDLERIRSDLIWIESMLVEETARTTQTVSSQDAKAFNPSGTALFYRTKGRLYAAGTLLRSLPLDRIPKAQLRSRIVSAQGALDAAARPAPLIVSNPEPGAFSFGGNDYIQQAYLTAEARSALSEALDALSDQADLPTDDS